jgi:hypothetical protein
MLNMLLLLDTNDDLDESMLPKLSLEVVESDRSTEKLFNDALEDALNPGGEYRPSLIFAASVF